MQAQHLQFARGEPGGRRRRVKELALSPGTGPDPARRASPKRQFLAARHQVTGRRLQSGSQVGDGRVVDRPVVLVGGQPMRGHHECGRGLQLGKRQGHPSQFRQCRPHATLVLLHRIRLGALDQDADSTSCHPACGGAGPRPAPATRC